NDDGGQYDSQEWVFVDLRTANAMHLGARPEATDLLGWVSAQAGENYDLISELHDAATGDYRGEMPMVGFGAGAYALALLGRVSEAMDKPCGDYADESIALPDGGSGGNSGDGGTKPKSDESDDGGCGCRAAPARSLGFSVSLLLVLAAAARRRRLS